MADVTYLKGDPTCPQAKGVKIISHVCNDLGGWGKGFVLALSKRWDGPEVEYRRWHAAGKAGGFTLGAVQFVRIESHVWVANTVAQHGIKRGGAGPPIRYAALGECLRQVGDEAIELAATVHTPRIGCGLAGGVWSEVEQLVRERLGGRGIAVTVYDFG